MSSNCVVIYVLCFLLAFETTEGNMWTWMQVELLLGKAYSEWGGHSGDAVAVYDGLISSHPDDFRGYLAKVRPNCGITSKCLIWLHVDS